MTPNDTKLQKLKYILSTYYFQILASIAILLTCYSSLEHQAQLVLMSANNQSLEMLTFTTEMKQLLAVVSGLNFAFVQEMSSTISQSLDKIENLLLVSSMISAIQIAVINLSQHLWLKLLAITLLAASFWAPTRIVSCKILILVLAINPGLAIYSVSVKALSTEISESQNSQLHAKLKTLSANLKTDTQKLTQQHQQEITKIKQGHSSFKFVKTLWSDAKYEVKKVETKVSDDYETLKIMLNGGGKGLLKEAIIYFSQLILLLVVLPLGYLWLVAKLFQKSFPNNRFVG